MEALKSILGTIAPTLATALGGPLAGGAVRIITEALGLSPEAKEKDIMDAIAADPEALARVKTAEIDYAKRIAELGVDLVKIAARDRDSARAREAKVGGFANPILAGIVIIGFFAVVWTVLSGALTNMDAAIVGLAGSVVGYVSAKADQVVAYYFGSSAGSARKTEILGKGLPPV